MTDSFEDGVVDYFKIITKKDADGAYFGNTQRDLKYFIDTNIDFAYKHIYLNSDEQIIFYCLANSEVFSYIVLDNVKHTVLARYTIDEQNTDIQLKTEIIRKMLLQHLSKNKDILYKAGMDPDSLIILLNLIDNNINIFYVCVEGLNSKNAENYISGLSNNRIKNKTSINGINKIAFISGHIVVLNKIDNMNFLLFNSNGEESIEKIYKIINNYFKIDNSDNNINIANLNDIKIQGSYSCFLMGIAYLLLLSGNDEKSLYFQNNLKALFINSNDIIKSLFLDKSNNPIGNLLVIEKMFDILNEQQKMLNIVINKTNSIYNTCLLANAQHFSMFKKIRLQNQQTIDMLYLINTKNVNKLIKQQINQEKLIKQYILRSTKYHKQLGLRPAAEIIKQDEQQQIKYNAQNSYNQQLNTQPPQQEIQNQNNNKQQENSNTPQMTTLPHIKKQLDKKEHDKTSQVVNL